MYYDSEEAHARIGSCSVTKQRCEDWKEKTKYLNGAHGHTPCEPQEKVWCYREVSVELSLLDFLGCYPSKTSCEDKLEDLYLEHGFQKTTSSCTLIDASEWLARDRGEDRVELTKFLTDYSDCTSTAMREIPTFLLQPETPPRKVAFRLNCNDPQLPHARERIQSARQVCRRVVTHKETLQYILTALDTLDRYLTDYQRQVCTPARLRCEHDAPDKIECFIQAGWPHLQYPDVHYGR